MTTTTSFGTWSQRINTYSSSPEQDIDNVMTGGGSEWYERMEESGALEKIQNEYRAAIEAVLPEGISLCGNEFYGPAFEADRADWSDYPQDDDGDMDIRGQVEGIDLMAIVERHDVDNA